MFNLLLINLLLSIKNFIITNTILYFIYYKLLFFSLKIKVLTISTNLLVGFNNIHPFLFYISFVYSFYNLIFLNKFLIYSVNYIYSLVTISLLLGGLWGSGNSAWGFFWLKDPIELLLLFLLIIIIFSIHINFNYCTLYSLIIAFFLMIAILYCLRNGFIFTKHNFFNINLRKNIIVYILYLFIFLLINKKYNIFLIIINIFITILLQFYYNFLILYLFQRVNKITNNYKFTLKLLHIIMFSLYFIWLKNRENNLSTYNFLNYNQIIMFNYYWTFTQVYNLIEIFILKYLNYLNYSTFYLYAYKFYYFIFINMSYIFFFNTILFLISNLKIVTK